MGEAWIFSGTIQSNATFKLLIRHTIWGQNSPLHRISLWKKLKSANINIIDLFSLNLILFDALFKFIVTFIDKEYRELYEKTERARLEWEAAMYKFCQVKSMELVYPVLVHFSI